MTSEVVASVDEGPLVTVVICVLDDWRVLRTLSSLTAQSVNPARFRVVVVASGREDYGAAVSRFPLDLQYIHTDVPRLAMKRNIGLAAVTTPYFLTIDADCVADPRWIEEMTRALRSGGPQVVGVGGRVGKYAVDTFTQRYGITVDDGQSELNYLPALDLPYVAGAAAGFVTKRVLAVGGYDETYRCGEDVDVCYKLGLAGGQLAIAEDAWIRHEDRRRVVDHYRRFRHLAIDQALLFKSYRSYSGRSWCVSPYKVRLVLVAAKTAIGGIPAAIRGDRSAVASSLATVVQAAGIFAGQVRGSLRHRVLYL
jgi:glycosyltransferase involved in cell wall biosynthesis